MITIYTAPRDALDSPAGLLRRSLGSDHPHGFGALQILDEERVPPSARSRARGPHDGEMLMYVRDGRLTRSESSGATGMLVTGDIRREVGARSIQTNASSTQSATIFWIGLRAAAPDPEAAPEQRHFTAAERRDRLRLVASPDGRKGSLRVVQDVQVYSALLNGGRHVVHRLSAGRQAWLHVVSGRAGVRGSVLSTADAAVIHGDRMVSVTARERTEILLFDVRDTPKSHGKRITS